MKISEKWLREWVNPAVNVEQLAHTLIMAGLEVESILPASGAFHHVVVGQIQSVEPHPKADRLTVCHVNVGQLESLQIVCGAKNVKPGLKVPVALIGATLKADVNIQKSTLREVESCGMMCSAVELGLQETSEGLLELPMDAPIGVDLREYLSLEDHVLDIKVTPNRGDCLSVLGVAREVGAVYQCEVTTTLPQKNSTSIKETVKIDILSHEACPVYVGRVIKNIQAKSTPVWMTERLRRSGLRSISPVVDVMNYVMLELGQPLHAFDYNAVKEGVVVRMATKDETLVLLDGKTVTLTDNTLVIADTQKPIAMAGVMGGLASSVSATTQDIFFESAYFTPDVIRGRARQYGVSSDAAYRFERGVDPQLQLIAMERATALLLEVVGGEVGPISIVQHAMKPPTPIVVRKVRVNQLLGVDISVHDIEKILKHLEFDYESTEDGWRVTIPLHRFDMALEVDVIEEVARLYGYDNIPTAHPIGALSISSDSETEVKLSRFTSALCDLGYHEAITYSFVNHALQKKIDPRFEGLALINPISQDMSVMRTTLLAGLLSTVQYNQNRQQSLLRLFETGLCFIQKPDALLQENRVAGVITGSALPVQWGVVTRPVDFFDIKGHVEQLLALTFDKNSFAFVPTQHPALHPLQGADIIRDGAVIGSVGLLHPQLIAALDIEAPCGVFELQLEALQRATKPAFTAISKFPEIRRDIAIIVKEEIVMRDVLAAIQQSAGVLLRDVCVFDRYAGQGIPEGHKSIALNLVLQEATRTLTDEEVEAVMTRVISTLTQSFAAVLRT